MAINNLEDIKNLIVSLEEKLPVDTWSVNNIDVWPVIRVKLFTDLNKKYVNNLARKSSIYGGTQKLSFKKKIKRFFNTFYSFSKLKKTDNLYTSTFSHRSLYENKLYNKFYDPIILDVNSSGIVIEHNSKDFYTSKEVCNKEKVLFFEDFVYVKDLIYSQLTRIKLYNPIKRAKLKQYNLFLDSLKSSGLPQGLVNNYNLKNLKPTLLKLHIYSKTYEKILRKTKPRYTFQVCHYSTNSVALSITSKKLNIPSIEIQHGPQPPLHLAYGNWSKIKEDGYNTLPKVFWNWDENSNNTIQKWQEKQDYHKSIILGNTWVDYLKPKLKKQKKEYVLYSLQPFSFDLLFPKHLIDFIKNSPLKFWMRIHPTDINRKAEYLNFFKENELNDYIFFDDGTTYSLPETLSFSKIHITNSSGCAIEAAQFGIKTILLDKTGKNYYEELISKKMAFIYDGSLAFGVFFNDVLNEVNSNQNHNDSKNYREFYETLNYLNL